IARGAPIAPAAGDATVDALATEHAQHRPGQPLAAPRGVGAAGRRAPAGRRGRRRPWGQGPKQGGGSAARAATVRRDHPLDSPPTHLEMAGDGSPTPAAPPYGAAGNDDHRETGGLKLGVGGLAPTSGPPMPPNPRG